MDMEALKRQAAARALEQVKDGMKLGLGTGSTARHFVDLLGEKVRAGLKVIGVPTSEATRAQAEQCGIPLTTLDDVDRLDLTVDGADEVDPALNLIKGAGAKLVQQWQDIATELPPQIAASLLPPPFGEQKRKSLADQLTLMPNSLSGSERIVLKLLSPDSPAHIDALLDQTKLPMSDLTSALLTLEMNELIRQLPGRCFVRKL